MAHEQHTYICIDLKTFYASVECVDRGLDPLTTNLVVADESRGRTTICLAITQAMKDLGIHNRCRLFEIPDGIDYITAVPRMQHYMEVSAQINALSPARCATRSSRAPASRRRSASAPTYSRPR